MDNGSGKQQNKNWFGQNWIALIALLISIFSVFYTHLNYGLQTKLSHLQIKPMIKTYFDLPVDKNPIFVVANEGSVPAVSLSCGYYVFTFNKNQKKVVVAGKAGRVFSPGVIYKELFNPTDYESMELVGVSSAENTLVIYQFDLIYFRKQDMDEYSRREYYFVDNGRLLSHSEYRLDPLYRDVMYQISQTIIPDSQWDSGALRQYLENQSEFK